MFRNLANIVVLAAMVVAGSVGLYVYYDHFSASRQIHKLEQEKAELQQIVTRLGDERRVAEVLVTEQKSLDGYLQTTLMFVEYARDGSTLPARQFTITGKTAHIDAMVVKFDQDFVAKDDPLRGHSIALFTRIYGEHQTPGQAYPIDEPGKIPNIYRGGNPQASEFEKDLWTNFWRLYSDEAYRKEKGVRVANGQGVWGPFEPDKLYTITIESDGGVNIKAEPLKGIYKEALKRSTSGPI